MSSDHYEQLFSSAGNIVHKTRSSLEANIVSRPTKMNARLQRSAYVVGYPSTLMIEKALGLFTVLN